MSLTIPPVSPVPRNVWKTREHHTEDEKARLEQEEAARVEARGPRHRGGRQADGEDQRGHDADTPDGETARSQAAAEPPHAPLPPTDSWTAMAVAAEMQRAALEATADASADPVPSADAALRAREAYAEVQAENDPTAPDPHPVLGRGLKV